MFSGAAEAAAIPSLLTCYASCGLVEDFSPFTQRETSTAATEETSSSGANMKRASVSRRSLQLQSPPQRSRSSEKYRDNARNNGLRLGEISDDAKRMLRQAEREAGTGRVAYDDDDEEKKDPREYGTAQNQQHIRPHHVRAMSDPFDTSEVHDELRDDKEVAANTLVPEAAYEPLYTLPRFPVADARNKNCWSQPPIDLFAVRGPRYFSDKKKVPSAPYLLQSRGCDMFVLENGDSEVNSINLEERTFSILGGQLRRRPTILVNFRFPWGFLCLYYEVPSNLVRYMDPDCPIAIDPALSTSEMVVAKWLQGDTDYKNERLKLISYVAEGPWVVRNMVTGRPAIIGKRLPVTYQLLQAEDKKSKRHLHNQHTSPQPLLICTLDIGNSSATAKRIVSVCRRYMSSLTVDIGFVVQAEECDELPEQMLGATRIHGPDPLKAITLK